LAYISDLFVACYACRSLVNAKIGWILRGKVHA
jgi:hypothetical protein